jgi:hypothetical protein
MSKTITPKDAQELFLLTTYYHIHLVIAELGDCFLVKRELLLHGLYWGKEGKGKVIQILLANHCTAYCDIT